MSWCSRPAASALCWATTACCCGCGARPAACAPNLEPRCNGLLGAGRVLPAGLWAASCAVVREALSWHVARQSVLAWQRRAQGIWLSSPSVCSAHPSPSCSCLARPPASRLPGCRGSPRHEAASEPLRSPAEGLLRCSCGDAGPRPRPINDEEKLQRRRAPHASQPHLAHILLPPPLVFPHPRTDRGALPTDFDAEAPIPCAANVSPPALLRACKRMIPRSGKGLGHLAPPSRVVPCTKQRADA